MPLYEYRCKACGHQFEVIQKFSDAPVSKCPKCRKSVERLLSSPAIHFKGTGWYVTDYARKGAASESRGEAKSDGKGGKESAKESASPTASENAAKEPSKPSSSSITPDQKSSR